MFDLLYNARALHFNVHVFSTASLIQAAVSTYGLAQVTTSSSSVGFCGIAAPVTMTEGDVFVSSFPAAATTNV